MYLISNSFIIVAPTVGIPFFSLLSPRDADPPVFTISFNSSDRADSPKVIIITEALAEQLWPGEDAVGKRLETPVNDWEWFEVIGVVGNTSFHGLGAERTVGLQLVGYDLGGRNRHG